jgi:hypothetical protein
VAQLRARQSAAVLASKPSESMDIVSSDEFTDVTEMAFLDDQVTPLTLKAAHDAVS